MSRRLFAFLLSELKTIRIICSGCKGVSEVEIDQVRQYFSNPDCRYCRKPLGFASHNNVLTQMANAIADIQTLQKGTEGTAKIEFVLPDDGERK